MTIKKLLKIFLYIFSFIFLLLKYSSKTHYYGLGSQKKERRRQETQNKKENTKEVTNIQNKIEEGQI